LLVPQYGQYTLTIQSSGPFTLTLGGEALLGGGVGLHSAQQVLIGGFYDFNLRYLAQTGTGGPVFVWQGPTVEKQVVSPSAFYAFEVPEFGLVGYYYPNSHWEGSPRVVKRDFFLTAGEVLPSPYSIIWRGKLLIDQPGLYGLGTNSDDGSLLYVDGQLVVDNDGPHGARYIEGSIGLLAGYHDIELRYFQDGGSRELELWWTLPDGKRELIPPTQLFPWEGTVRVRQPVSPEQAEPLPPGALADQVWQVWDRKTVGDEGEGVEARGVAISPITGWIYVADAVNRHLRVFDADGVQLSTFGQDAEFREPGDLVVDSQGDVFVLDPPADSVVRFTADGQLVARYRGELGLFRPRGIGIDRFDRLYIADTGSSRVVIMSRDGDLLAVWGGSGTGPGQFDQPTDVAVGGEGQVYVVDTFNQRIQWLDADGAYLGEWPIRPANTYDSPHLAASPANVLYVTSPEEHQVLAYDLTGRLLGQFGGEGSSPGQFLKPVATAVDAAGRLYVTDPLQGRVQGFQPAD
jgi:sugar lactone lactonase YvrE